MTPKIIAHRGASSLAPENTLAAIQLAWEQSADGIEVDVHLSKDHRLVVMHDANTKRTTGRNWLVASHTLGELKTLDAGKWKHRKWAGEKIPVLEEILASLPANKTLTLEIKCGLEAIAPLQQVLKHARPPTGSVAIASFSLPVVREAKKNLPKIPAYWISNFKKKILGRGWSPKSDELIKKADGLDGLYLRACGAITPSLVCAVREAGLALHVWTVDSPAQAKRMIGLGVDSITTNRPGWLREKIL